MFFSRASRFRRSKYARSGRPMARTTTRRKPRYIAKRKAYKKTGFITIKRKGVTAHVYNNSAGTDFATNSSWLTLGAKSASASALPNSYNIPFSATFRASDMYNWIELQPLAEKFKLKWVKIYINCTSTNAGVNSLSQVPTLLWDTSADDDTVPTYNIFKEQMGIKRKVLANGRSAVIFIKPKLTAPVFSGVGTNSIQVQRSCYLNTDSTSAATEHYGLNGVLEDMYLNPQTLSALDVKFDIEYGLSLRDIK